MSRRRDAMRPVIEDRIEPPAPVSPPAPEPPPPPPPPRRALPPAAKPAVPTSFTAPEVAAPTAISARVTTRVVLLLLLGTVPLMVVQSHWHALITIAAFNLVVAALIRLDHWLTPVPEALEVERLVARRLSLGEDNPVKLRLVNHARQPLTVVLRDEFPEGCTASTDEVAVKVAARSSATVTYRLKPLRRGRFVFGNLVLRHRGSLDLIDRQMTFPLADSVEVYPNIKAISRLELRFRRQHLTEMGLVTERRRGMGTEFESLREYTIGDEMRKIDWKASARKNKLISREFQSEINQSVIVAIDGSRPMGAVVDGYTLLDAAVNGALLLGHLVTRKDDKLGLLVFDDQVRRYLAPKRGKRNFHLVLDQVYDLQPQRVEPDFDAAIRFLMASRLKRSLIVILTDLSAGDAPKKMTRAIWLLCRKHLPVVVSITDPTVWRAAEGVPQSSLGVFQQVAALEILNRVKQAKRAIESLGGLVLLLRPNEVSTSLLSSYLSVKLRATL